MEAEKLLPCPFCGSPASLYHATRAINAHVTCSSEACEACGPALYSPEAAIEMWNKRPALAAQAAEIEAMRADAERYRWLREDPPTSLCVRIDREGCKAIYTDGYELDKSIDAARQAAGSGEAGSA